MRHARSKPRGTRGQRRTPWTPIHDSRKKKGSILVGDTPGSPYDYDFLILQNDAVYYYPQGGVIENGSYTGGSGGSVEVVWDGTTGYFIHIMADGEIFTPDTTVTANVLRVAGGGPGGSSGDGGGGGGGGGGEVDIEPAELISSAQMATVGSGGTAWSTNGGDTTFNGRTVKGGGYGGSLSGAGANGGNGGGGAVANGAGGTSTATYSGFAGFAGTGSISAGGGGGAGEAAVDGGGGDGVLWDGDDTYYGGGGGGGRSNTFATGHQPGGLGGGGRGAEAGSFADPALPGTDGLGGGGGGGGTGGPGLDGGDGIVKIRYNITAGA